MALKRIITFESYAHNDREDVDHLRAKLLPNLKILKDLDFQIWSDRQIDLGSNWLDRIKQALIPEQDQLCAGLLYLSPDFFASEFISTEELPILLKDYPLLFPVMLKQLDSKIQDLKGLEQRQWFQYKGKSYKQSRQRDEFAFHLTKAIKERCNIYLNR